MSDSRNPPELLLAFLSWFCRSDRFDEISGDLIETYESEKDVMPLWKARWRFSVGLLYFFKPHNLKLITNMTMILINNYLQVGIRNLKHYKVYSSLNILGLTVGLTSALFMTLFVLDELSYDRQFANHDRIYRIVLDAHIGSSDYTNPAITPSSLGRVMKDELPEVEEFVSLFNFKRFTLKTGEKNFTERQAFVTSKNCFSVFDFELLVGNPETVFNEPNSIVISESRAYDYFGTTDIIGKEVELVAHHNGIYTITGILKDPIKKAHIQAHILAYQNDEMFDKELDAELIYYTYILLNKGVYVHQFEEKLTTIYDKYLKRPLNETFEVTTGRLVAQKLTDIHLHSNLTYEIMPGGSEQNVWIMGVLAGFILLVVSINYMNLATARATKRIKEIGIRSILGSTKRMLKMQFLTESALITFLSAMLSIVLVAVFIPSFNHLSGKEFAIEDILNIQMLGLFVLLVLFVGIVGGSYPGFFLSRFSPADIFRKNLAIGSRHIPMGKILNAVQFTVALTMIILTWTVYEQIKFARNFDLGFKQDQILKVDLQNRLGAEIYYRIKTELKKYPYIENMAVAMKAPGDEIGTDGLPFEMPDGSFAVQKVEFNIVDEGFIPVLDIELIAGRNFKDEKSDEWARVAIVNEKLVNSLGYAGPKDILDKQVKLPLDDDFRARIIGVVKDYHVRSLHHEISPMLLVNFVPISTTLLVKANGLNLNQTLATLDDVVQGIRGSNSYDISFLDQDIWDQYQKDERQGHILVLFASLTILLSFMGLLALVSFSVELKMKEMIIRKVFGANFSHVLVLFIKQYAIVILIAIVIAIPSALLLGEEWLNNFVYRIDMNINFIILSSFGLILTMFIIIMFQSRRSFVLNPIDRLRTE